MYNKVNSVLYVGNNQNYKNDFGLNKVILRKTIRIKSYLEASDYLLNTSSSIDIIFIDEIINNIEGTTFFKMLRQFKRFESIVFILISDFQLLSKSNHKKIKENGVDEVLNSTFSFTEILPRLNFLIEYRKLPKIKKNELKLTNPYKISPLKRVFDILIAITALIIVSPILTLIILAIKIESKGPIFYSSKRVGTGYKTFDFYKLRSMKIDAENELKNIKDLNQYKNSEHYETPMKCNECQKLKHNCSTLLFIDGKTICENHYRKLKKANKLGTFIKISNDPRITKVGKFIRNTSIDELPQLINVLKGDMSIVGNRPLPIYEAEQLTTDQHALRFMAPAGITGLWQVEKRGGNEMNEQERKNLDNIYAKKHNFFYDLKLIFRTIPALIQSDNV